MHSDKTKKILLVILPVLLLLLVCVLAVPKRQALQTQESTDPAQPSLII